MHIFYDKNSAWEIDYIKNDILASTDKGHTLHLIDTTTLASLRFTPPTCPIVGNCAIVFTSNCIRAADIIAVIRAIKPRIVVHLSDEFGTYPEYLQIGRLTPLYLRNYSHAAYGSAAAAAHQFPLGYMTGMLEDKPSTGLVVDHSHRPYRWAFIGTIKQDRADAVAAFTAYLGEGFIGNGLSAPDMYKIYRYTVFVPVGRGNTSLDCFRIYEAIIAGAIPVVVGEEAECAATFSYGGDIPPLLFAGSWDAAARAAAAETEVDCCRRREALVAWWNRQLHRVRQLCGSRL